MKHAIRKINKKIMIALLLIAWLFLLLALAAGSKNDSNPATIPEKAAIEIDSRTDNDTYISSLIFC